MIGSLEISGSEAIRFKNLTMAASESSIPSSMFTSIIWAPPSTCWRATAKASSKFPLNISLENLGDPVMLVRSPIFTKLVRGVNVTGSRPLSRIKGSGTGGTLGGNFAALSAIHFICSGVVPQHPPTILTNPFAIKSSTRWAVSCGNSS